MLKNKIINLSLILLMACLVLVACSQDEGKDKNEMAYITVEDLKDSIEDSGEYILLDIRKLEDYEDSHIKGSYEADVDAANKGGDDEAGKANLKDALIEASGNEKGNPDDKYVLICYSGKSYAQKATDLLIEMGISKEQILTLEGGMKAWIKAGQDYKDLLE